jgi:hypothetical protein
VEFADQLAEMGHHGSTGHINIRPWLLSSGKQRAYRLAKANVRSA